MDMKMGLSALKSFYIMQILLERTDEVHSLNATQIRDILENVYGVKIDRHTAMPQVPGYGFRRPVISRSGRLFFRFRFLRE